MKYNTLEKLYYNRMQFEEEYSARKNNPNSVSLGFHINDWEAFYCMPPELVSTLLRIYKKYVELGSLCAKLPPMACAFYERKCLVDEIVITNDIEGIYSTRKEVIEVLNQDAGVQKKQRFEGLIHKYALLLDESPLSYHVAIETPQDIRNIYNDIVLDEIAPKDRPDGVIFRKDAAEVISGTQQVKHIGIHPEEKIIEYVEKVLQLFKQDEIPKLLQIALLHYMIGYIHPFYDGNGRLSRFLSSYLLKQEFGTLVALRLSYTIKNLKPRYYKAFDVCNEPKNRGELTPFIVYFVDVIEQSIDFLIEKLKNGFDVITRLSDLLHQKYDHLNTKERKKTFDVLWFLVQNELFSIEHLDRNRLSYLLQVAPLTAHNYVSELISKGVPIEIQKDGRKDTYTLNIDALYDYLLDNQ